MLIRCASLFLILCSAAHAQHEGSLRGPVSSIKLFRKDLHTPGTGMLELYSSAWYDSAGNTSRRAGPYRTSEYCYDGNGRLSCVNTWDDEGEGNYHLITYGYLTEEHHSDFPMQPVFIQYRYDERGQVIEEHIKSFASNNDTSMVLRSYDEEGRLITERGSSRQNERDRAHGRPASDRYLATTYHYSAPESCIETPLGEDCSCATLARVVEQCGRTSSVKKHQGYTAGGRIKWERKFRDFDAKYYPIAEDFKLFDIQGRDSILFNRGVAYSGEDIHYPQIQGCIRVPRYRVDTTQWLAIFHRYDQYDNYLGQQMYIYNTLSDLRNGKGRLARESTIDYTLDSYGNWTRQVERYNGNVTGEWVRIIEYYSDAMETRPNQRQDLH